MFNHLKFKLIQISLIFQIFIHVKIIKKIIVHTKTHSTFLIGNLIGIYFDLFLWILANMVEYNITIRL